METRDSEVEGWERELQRAKDELGGVPESVRGTHNRQTPHSEVEGLVEARVERYGMAYKGILPDDAVERSKAHWRNELLDFADVLLTTHGAKEREVDENTSDGYHTFKELYEFRLLYNAALFNEWAMRGLYNVHKSQRHFDGELCFGRADYFVVVAELPTGQISNHYPMSDWDLFECDAVEKALVQWDGHTSHDVAVRLRDFLTPQTDVTKKTSIENKLPREMYPLCPVCKKQTVAGAHMTSNDSRDIYCTSGDCNYDVSFEMLTTPVPAYETDVTKN